MMGEGGSDEKSSETWPGRQSKSQFMDSCKSCKVPQDNPRLTKLIYEAVIKTVNSELRVDQVIPVFKEIALSIPEAASIIADVMQLVDLETHIDVKESNKSRNRKRGAYLHVLTCMFDNAVGNTILKERLDFETVCEAGIIQNKKAINTKFVRLKTRLFYKQQKFNLLREESEGYSKLITELSQDNEFEIDYMLRVIRSLIGCFNLDPNRVLDIILEVFEQRPRMEKSFVSLILRFLENKVTLAQVIAFKFSFYRQECTPESLYHLLATLVNNRLLDLDDFYCYLSPKDELINDHYKFDLEEAKAIARKANTISTVDEKEKEELFSPAEKYSLKTNNQKLGVVRALLKIGNWKDARTLMDMMPENYCLMFDDKVRRNICRLISIGIDEIYRGNSGLPSVLAKRLKSISTWKIKLFKPATTVREFIDTVVPLIEFLGPFIYSDSLLMIKLIRIFKVLVKKDLSDRKKKTSDCKNSLVSGDKEVEAGEEVVILDENSVDFEIPIEETNTTLEMSPELKGHMINILDECILPGLSLTESNCGLTEELWSLLRLLPYEIRYRLYQGWKRNPNNSLLLKKRALDLKKIKYYMKRLSKENVKPTGRQIGKLSHSNPSFLFDNILSQIQTYDNLIGPVVDSFKYLTTISFDVLIYSIIEILADSSKGRTKHDGATISPWIVSLANFCGHVVKRYSVELPGLFQFIANQLKDEKSLDLLVLKEIVTKMAGIETTEQMTNDQLAALSGGELLRQEGGYFNQVRNTRKSSMRLKDALLENNLAMPLCVLMAQQRNCILFKEQEHSHLKLVGKLYDQCQETLVQFGAFLSTCLSIDDYSGRLPPLDKLLTQYSLNPDVAFFLLRPMVSYRIAVKYEENRKNKLDASKAYQEAFTCVTSPMIDTVLPSIQKIFWEDLSPRFFVTFWTLSMYDLEVPKSSYDRETDKLKQQIQSIEENLALNSTKKKKDIERTRLLLEKLLEEQLKQDQHVSRVRSTLDSEKDQWFHSNLKKMEMIAQFYQYCLFPRSVFTASDALYSAKFIHTLHTLKTPNFSTLICYDRVFGDISYTMSSCTENEASHYGLFLSCLLDTVMRWHKDRCLFDKECSKFPGFVTKFTDDVPSYIDYEDYRHVCHKWHYRLTKALILCLDSEDYIQVRNSLVILTKIIGHFPVITTFALSLEKRVEALRTKEKDNRKDLYALATGYVGLLKQKKPTFMPEHDFHYKESRKGAPSPAKNTMTSSAPASSSSKTEQTSKSRIDKVKQESHQSDRGSPSSTPKREDKDDSSSSRIKKERDSVDTKASSRQTREQERETESKRGKESKMEIDSSYDHSSRESKTNTRVKIEGPSRSKDSHQRNECSSSRDHRSDQDSRSSFEVKRERVNERGEKEPSSSKRQISDTYSFDKKTKGLDHRNEREYSSERKGKQESRSNAVQSMDRKETSSSKSSVDCNTRIKEERMMSPETSNGTSSSRVRSIGGRRGDSVTRDQRDTGSSKRCISNSNSDSSPNKRRKRPEDYYDNPY